jgi:hypothetical protein
MQSARVLILLTILSPIACTTSSTINPCREGEERRPGTETLHVAADPTKAILFIQTLERTPSLFWPERLAQSSIFHCHSMLVHGTDGEEPVSAIVRSVRTAARQHRETVLVTFDVTSLAETHAALSQLSEDELRGIVRIVLFSLPQSERPGPSAEFARVQEGSRTVCITFDERRFEHIPFARSICDRIVLARMDDAMIGAPPCDDALYPIFEVGLASELYVACKQPQ